MRLLWMVAFVAGCYGYVEDRCPPREVISAQEPLLPVVDARRLVVLVPGAFGMGSEWAPVLRRLRAEPDVRFFAYSWPGPWSGIERRVDELAAVLQGAVDDAGPRAVELLVIGHSAGAVIAEYAARRLRVPPGLRVRVAAIAPPMYLLVLPLAPPPPGVEVTEYVNADRDDGPVEPGVRRVLLGSSTGHSAAVAKAGLPLLPLAAAQ